MSFRAVFSVVASGALALFARCTMSTEIAGGTIETTNGIVATICYEDGRPAAGAVVRLREEDFLATIPPGAGKRTSIDSTTDTLDAMGRLAIDSVMAGSYLLEVNDQNGYALALRCAVLRHDSLIDLGVDTLEPVATVIGQIPPDSTAYYVQVYGLDRIAVVDPLTGDFSIPDLPAGNYTLSVTSANPIAPAIVTDPIIVQPADSVRLPKFFAWSSGATFVLNTTATGADVAGDVFDFPVTFRLNATNFDFAKARNDGADIRFMKADSTQLPYEIERWDSTTNHAVVWVKLDTVWGNCDTQKIILLWGNPAASRPFSSGAAVFDTAEGFQGVWHMNDPAIALITDATSNNFAGTPYNANPGSVIDGAVGKARYFNGKTNYIEMMGTASGKINFPANGTYTISCWVYPTALDSARHALISKGWFQYHLSVGEANTWEFNQFKAGYVWENLSAPAKAKAWTNLVAIRNDTTQYLYVNGVCVDSTITLALHEAGVWDSTGNWQLGRCPAPGEKNYYFQGRLDEVRIQSNAPSADWIKLCYMNQRPLDQLVTFKP